MKLLIQNSLPFQALTQKNCQKPLKTIDLPPQSWEHIVVDFKEPLPSGDYLLVVIDTQDLLKLKSQNQPP